MKKPLISPQSASFATMNTVTNHVTGATIHAFSAPRLTCPMAMIAPLIALIPSNVPTHPK